MKLIFATQNKNKFIEISHLIPRGYELTNLTDLNFTEELPENQLTIEGNAREKAKFIYNAFGINCFADDTGLEIESLDGRPGVFSARYGGESKNPDQNIAKVLNELNGVENRQAQFKTVIALWFNGNEYLFEGIVSGEILQEKRGSDGFGYDPIFLPKGHLKSFAEMPLEEKNQISHRAMAFNKLKIFLDQYSNKK